ncbi:MAG: hypothetical protein AAGF11_48440 [Myxococcota bacterium]
MGGATWGLLPWCLSWFLPWMGGCSPREPGVPDTGTTAASGSGPTAGRDETTGPRLPASLVDHTAWVPVEVADDPVPNHRPSDVNCGVVGAYVEGTGYEIDTGACNYCARQQPSLVEIRAGDILSIAAFHDTLASIEAGQAHMALLLAGWPVWQEFIPIPASPGVVDATPFSEEIVVNFDIPAGTPVVLHLHNHGYNTWTLLDVEVIPAEAVD